MSVINVQIDGFDNLLKSKGLGKGGRVQKYIDEAVVRFCQPYCPMDSGLLSQSPSAVTDFGSGEVVYPGPYAHYQYYGEVYGPNIPIFEDDSGEPTRWVSPKGQKKHPTGRQLQYRTDKNPMAGSFWFERMKADRAKDILEGAIAVANEQ